MTPKQQGFFFPAEWHPHRATWLTFPKNADTWEDRFDRIYPAYMAFIKELTKGEKVCINAHNKTLKKKIEKLLDIYAIDPKQVELCLHPSNDSWCRDHGGAVLINPKTKQRMIVNWGYNAWGGKYPPFDADNNIPVKMAEYLGLPYTTPPLIMEGGSVEFNGAGTVLTSESCLLNKNRNPQFSKIQIEQYLCDYYGIEQVLWVKDGIVGDDTDGHIDDTTRFVNENTLLTAIEHNKTDANYHPLHENWKELEKMNLKNGQKLNLIELPMPSPVYDKGERLPASYANFYIANKSVIVPTYRSKNEDEALQIIQNCFPSHEVVGIDSTEIIWGLGSFHCLSQQEPMV